MSVFSLYSQRDETFCFSRNTEYVERWFCYLFMYRLYFFLHDCNTMSTWRHTQTIKPSNKYELFLKSSLSAKGRRSTDPITNFRAKVRTATFLEGISTPPSLPARSCAFLHRTDKGKPNSWQLLQLSTQINIWIFNVYSFPHRHDVMISNANYLKQRGWFLIMF